MVNVNGVEMPLAEQSGVLVLEERFKSMEVGSRVFPPEGTVYLYALKTDTSDTHPWGVVYKAERPMAWHSNQWMAAQGFVPEGGR